MNQIDKACCFVKNGTPFVLKERETLQGRQRPSLPYHSPARLRGQLAQKYERRLCCGLLLLKLGIKASRSIQSRQPIAAARATS